MYLPAHFAEPDTAALHALMQAHPLATLVRQGPDGLDADHLPFHLLPDTGPSHPYGTLQAHVARANPLWQQADGAEVLVMFHGPQAYVSPSWYPSKLATHRQVPTWNYEVVHAHGRLKVHDDARWVRALLARLTRTHEADLPQPWKMGDAPPDYLDEMVAKVVGIELVITRLVGKRKLSQNRDEADRLAAADALAARGADELARHMRGAGGA
ncbi:FMN-binding negative transcriptional regulator [Ideonella livida]|uniref:FMN-binding negative transcriptional regulator n=1 Tax=Ideonella livida TaxID=2707176 RepID=A0A7C9PJZ7_9BURK|nr:FMN-binding negative transcriptional regulator [Ideonella livida]NDY92894.1 FMN-binding negative transcriptional regulator [Ideonella livida]